MLDRLPDSVLTAKECHRLQNKDRHTALSDIQYSVSHVFDIYQSRTSMSALRLYGGRTTDNWSFTAQKDETFGRYTFTVNHRIMALLCTPKHPNTPLCIMVEWYRCKKYICTYIKYQIESPYVIYSYFFLSNK